MNVYYNVEIQMAGTHEMGENLLAMIESRLGADDTDIDEVETYRAVMFFKSDIMPSEMERRVRSLLEDKEEILHYVDVVYRWESEMNCDRFVMWADGRKKSYTGHTIFEED